MRIRKNAATMTVAEKTTLVDALKNLKSKQVAAPDGTQISLYDTYVAVHLGVTRLEKNGILLPGGASNGGHNNAAFLSWHREFIRRVEEELRLVANDPDLTIPYWDWADHSGTMNEIFVDNFMGGGATGQLERQGRKVDATHPFSKRNGWPIDPRVHISRLHLNCQWGDELRRNMGSSTDLPNLCQIEALFETDKNDTDKNDFEKFREALESGPQMHNAMHGWVGGSMLDFSSPNDPIFMLNHANIDRLWALWQSYGHFGESHYPDSGEPSGHNLQDPMWPWDGGSTEVVTRQDIWNLIPRTVDDARPAHVLDCRALNYAYVNWDRVKEILDSLMDRWRQAKPGVSTEISNDNDDILAIHGGNFGWYTTTDLAKSTAFGLRLIETNKVGNGRGFETNLVKVLKEGIPQEAPQMPKGGPYLRKIEIAEIAHWIDSGMPE